MVETFFRPKLRLFGRADQTVCAPFFVGRGRGAAIGPSHRWVVTQAPVEMPATREPIASLTFSDLPRAMALGYEISAWAHLHGAPDSLLAPMGAIVDYRQSLINHFYANVRLAVPTRSDDLEAAINSALSIFLEALDDIGLRPQAGIIDLPVGGGAAERTAHHFTASFKSQAWSRVGAHSHAIVADLNGMHVLFLVRDEADHLDDLGWYRQWVLTEGMREVLRYGNELLADCQTAASRLAKSLRTDLRGKERLAEVLDSRAELLDVIDRVQLYRLMTATVDTFSRGVDLSGLADAADDQWQSVFDLVSEETYPTLTRPIQTLKESLDNLVRTSELRLTTLTEIAEISYNANAQHILTRLQWLTFAIAMATLGVGLFFSLHRSSGTRIIIVPSPSSATTPSRSNVNPERTVPTGKPQGTKK